MSATNLNHVSVSTPDLQQSIRFYQDLLGLKPVPTPNFGFPVQWMRVGDLQLHLFERPGDAPTYHHLGFTVDDFAAVYRKAKEMDIFDSTTFGYHLHELPQQNAQLYLRDPGGNLIEINYPDISQLPEDVLQEMRKLADIHPQTEENMQATLFLGATGV